MLLKVSMEMQILKYALICFVLTVQYGWSEKKNLSTFYIKSLTFSSLSVLSSKSCCFCFVGCVGMDTSQNENECTADIISANFWIVK